jgi:hypothetical protein
VLIAADFDACAGRQCAPAPRSGPSLPPSGYFPTAVRCYRSFARSGVTALRCESWIGAELVSHFGSQVRHGFEVVQRACKTAVSCKDVAARILQRHVYCRSR